MGHTLASGTSSCACAAVAGKLGLVDEDVRVNLARGCLKFRVSANYEVHLSGGVYFVFEGQAGPELFAGP